MLPFFCLRKVLEFFFFAKLLTFWLECFLSDIYFFILQMNTGYLNPNLILVKSFNDLGVHIEIISPQVPTVILNLIVCGKEQIKVLFSVFPIT